MTPQGATDSRRRSFHRKIGYLAAICVLLMPLFWLSHPATHGSAGRKGRSGGLLAQLRNKHGLSQTQLGEIDLTSETVKLATLGMRGIAVQTLWAKAQNQEMKKDWTALRATLEQITKLQPHFIAVWRYQGWNISYNVSVAFDDYHDKFYWLVEGIKYLQEGIRHNEREPRLPKEVGWFIANKIGKADEVKAYRRLFRDETYFQTEGQGLPLNPDPGLDRRDNWQVGKAWFREGERVFGDYHNLPPGMSEVIFFSDAPLAQMYYADALEKDGRFGQVTHRAWEDAARDWREFGDREFQVLFTESERRPIRLNDQEKFEKQQQDAVAKLDELVAGARQKIRDEKRARLKPAEQKALDKPAEQRSPDEQRLAMDAEAQLAVSNDEVAYRAAGDKRRQALDLSRQAAGAEQMALHIRHERSKVNFEYWRLRADVEQTDEAFAAREAIYQADQAYGRADIVAARNAYEKGLQHWRKVFDKHPALKDDGNLGADLVDAINRYRRALGQDEKTELPKPFVLQDILDKYEKKR